MENPKSGSLRRRNYGIGAGCSYLIIVIREFFFLMGYSGKWRNGSHMRGTFQKEGNASQRPKQPCISCFYIAMKKIP